MRQAWLLDAMEMKALRVPLRSQMTVAVTWTDAQRALSWHVQGDELSRCRNRSGYASAAVH